MNLVAMEFAHFDKINSLSSEQRADFYARLANHLTIVVRWICGHETWSDADKVEKLARLNEIQHRVSSAVVGARGSGKDWLTGAFSQLVASHVAEDKELLTLVERVVERTYTRVTQASEQAAEQGVAPDANAANVQLT